MKGKCDHCYKRFRLRRFDNHSSHGLCASWFLLDLCRKCFPLYIEAFTKENEKFIKENTVD